MTKLTKSMIDAAEAGSGDRFLWDSTLPGFGIRIKSSGVKSFLIQYRNRQGRSRRVTLGRYGQLTLEEARREARTQLSSVAQGRDPRQERADDLSGMSIRQLAHRYMTDHCEGRCKPSTIKAHQWLLDKFILPALGRASVHELRHRDIDLLHQRLKTTPYNANRVLGLLRAMYGRAQVWGITPRGTDPTAGVVPFRERKRQRFLSIEELKRLARAIDDSEAENEVSPYVAGALRLLIVTGGRLGEIQRLRWDQIDWAHGLIVLTEHKADAGGAKALPLNSAAAEVLRRIPPMPGNPYVFAGFVDGQPIADMQKPWQRVRRRAGLPDLRIHDLRHSFASFGIAAGASLPVIGGLLGHRSLTATATYAHLSADPLQVASESIAKLIAHDVLGTSEP
ncbi:tyrosine-type recombinase/integrase [Oceanibaculum nanhaiense]|uniref:tyrosine-type recombinase/integrase n=1 Tax=Oceanibaculum nanhaiense TaxID=1909734 RepID=UPI003D293A30